MDTLGYAGLEVPGYREPISQECSLKSDLIDWEKGFNGDSNVGGN
jgi:hypothetical protein